MTNWLSTKSWRRTVPQLHHDVELSPAGIWRILRRLDIVRLPPSQRYGRPRDRFASAVRAVFARGFALHGVVAPDR